MQKPRTHISHQRGPNRNELARKPQPRDRNFRQSRDIHEDRGERQIKMTVQRGTLRSAPKRRG